METAEWLGYQVAKSFKIGFALYTIPACGRQTDIEIDRHTDRQTSHDGVDLAMQSVSQVKSIMGRWVYCYS